VLPADIELAVCLKLARTAPCSTNLRCVQSNDLHPDRQRACRHSFSTESAISQVSSEIHEVVDDGGSAAVLTLLDLSAGFCQC
jgi:hypothetical protein